MKNKLKLLYFLFFKNAKKLSDNKLESTLRARVHGIEKQGKDEEITDFSSLIWGRQLFHEAKHRNLLSPEEISWCESVLFGKSSVQQIQNISDILEEQFFNILKDRRSIRSWQEGDITDNEFKKLIEAAKWAPSSSHRQSWHFLLIRNREKIKIISEIRRQKFLMNAPNCIIILINIEAYKKVEVDYTPYLDAAAAIQNLLLMAHVLGLGACWVNFGQHEIPDQKKMQRIKNLFGIPENLKILSVIPIGRIPSIPRHAPGRKATEDIMHIEKF